MDYKQPAITYAMEFSGAMKNGSVAVRQADIRFDPAHLDTAKAVMVLSSGSVSYEDAYIKNDIGAEDGLAAAYYLHMRAELGQFSKKDGWDNDYQAKGGLTMHGIIQSLILDFRFSEANGQAIYQRAG